MEWKRQKQEADHVAGLLRCESTREANFLGVEVFSFPSSFHFPPKKGRSSVNRIPAKKPSFSSPKSKNTDEYKKEYHENHSPLMGRRPLGQILTNKISAKESSVAFSRNESGWVASLFSPS